MIASTIIEDYTAAKAALAEKMSGIPKNVDMSTYLTSDGYYNYVGIVKDAFDVYEEKRTNEYEAVESSPTLAEIFAKGVVPETITVQSFLDNINNFRTQYMTTTGTCKAITNFSQLEKNIVLVLSDLRASVNEEQRETAFNTFEWQLVGGGSE